MSRDLRCKSSGIARALGAVPQAQEQPVASGKHGVNIRNALNMALRQEVQTKSKIGILGKDVASY